MKIILTINCGDFVCVAEKLKKAAEFGPPAGRWVQIDIADGKFTKHLTWNKSQELRSKNYELSKLNIEVHLMVENPLAVIDDWIKAGARRIIIHIEAVKFPINNFQFSKDVELGLAINPNTPVEKLIPFLKDFKFVQILAVNPGLSGQKFQPQVLEKIKFLKKNFPDVIIEIDGGINLETAKLCQEAGADILAVGSYIWESNNPQEAYRKLLMS